MTASALSLGGAALIWALYRAIETKWPFSYLSVDDLLTQRVSLSPTRYVAFRLAPVLLGSAFISSVAQSTGANGFLVAVMAAALHAVHTHGTAIFALIRQGEGYARRASVAIHIGLVALVSLGGFGGAIIARSPWFQPLVPPVDQIPADLWSAVLAAALTAAYIKATQGSSVETSDLVAHARRLAGSDIIDFARAEAQGAGSDPYLVEAILLAEALQRPRWLRSAERVFGRLLGVRTYGIMQVRSAIPISDRESIRIAVSQHLANVAIDNDRYWEEVERIARRYNGDERFVRFVLDFYGHLRPSEF